MTAAQQTIPRSDTIADWRPEDAVFWDTTGRSVAWRTLWITTANLMMAFIAWFLVSALVVRLPGIGFKFTPTELFWLTAMPGLAGGSLRIIHTFLIPIFGTRRVVGWSTLSLVVPLVGLTLAVRDPGTPYWVLMALAFAGGLGGGNFSSFMPSTSLFFPKRLQGTALAIQAGIGNFGVSVVQFVTPWVIGFAILGTTLGEPEVFTKGGVTSNIWLQNAAVIYLPLVVVFGVAALFMLKSVPVKADVREQMDIFKNKHTWLMTSLYLMTFGSFSGFSATFPLLIKQVYGGLPGAPDPLAYAFLGPLVGSLMRVAAGPLSDRFGGAIVTHVAGIGLLASAIGVTYFTAPTSVESFPYFVGLMLCLFFFTGVGNASTFKQMPMIMPPRQAGGVIGWTAAVAAYGPFLFGMLFGASFAATGSPNAFFYGVAVFYVINIAINWWFYTRKGCEAPC